jgi:hypothetical protein
VIFEALHPFVAPSVIGCPIPVMDHHIRLSAIEFCDKTRWHEEACFVSRSGNTGVYEFDVEQGLEIVRITSVSVADAEIFPKTKTTGLQMIAAGSLERFFVVIDPLNIQINPVPAVTDAVHVVAALRPAINATRLHEALIEWRDSIASGAIGRIAALPGQSFSSLDVASVHRGIFNAAIQSALVKQGLGSSESRPVRRVQTF